MSDYIPQDSLVQIFKLLPVESLLRFRCVCKWWKHIIDSPYMLQEHLAVQNPRFVLGHEDSNFVVLDPRTVPLFKTLCGSIVDQRKRLHVVGTLHGVICLCDIDNQIDLFLWNPSIRKFTTLPLPSVLDKLYFTWHRSESGDLIGSYSAFWIDPSTKEFKIIAFKLVHNHDNEGVYIDGLTRKLHYFHYGAIYSSIEQDWKLLSVDKVRYYRPLLQNPAIVIGKVAYWRAFTEKIDERGRHWRVVAIPSFNFGLERFDTIDAPSIKCNMWGEPVLGNWQSTLSLLYFKPDYRCQIYLRQENLWVNMLNFNLTSDICHVSLMFGDTERKGRVIVEEMQEKCRILGTVVEDVRLQLVLCDTRADFIPLVSIPEELPKLFTPYEFVESLLFPEG